MGRITEEGEAVRHEAARHPEGQRIGLRPRLEGEAAELQAEAPFQLGEEVLTVAGLDASQRRYVGSARSWVRMAFVVAANLVLSMILVWPLAWMFTAMLPYTARSTFELAYLAAVALLSGVFTWSARRLTVEVGADGVLVRRPWSRRFAAIR